MDRYAHYGNLHDGFAYYPDKRDLVEVSDTVYFDRKLSELQCSLAWVLHTLCMTDIMSYRCKYVRV